jgi:tripartite-type tricarboxylate transporter receptor subunit TctC
MDSTARVLSPKLADALGQPFVVENRTGAAGAIAADALARAAADGYTLLLAETGTLVVPSLNPKATYDPVRQFAPVGAVCTLPLALVASPAFRAASVPELVSLLKSDPGKHSYASPGIGTLQHLAFELFKRSAGVDALHVPYKGAAAMMPDLMSGQIGIGVISAQVAVSQSRAGRIRALAVTSPQRLSAAPDIPALAETLPGFAASPSVFVVAPVSTPPSILALLNGSLQKVLGMKEIIENLEKQGATVTPGSASQLGAQIAEETRRWAAVVRDAGIRLE